MNNKRQAIYLVEALRTPIGKLNGALAHWRPDDLAATVMQQVLQKAKLAPELVDGVLLGCANQAGEDNRNVARMAALLAGLPHSSTALTVNSLCSSSAEAIFAGLRQIALGEGDCYLVGGIESMSRSPLVTSKIDQEQVDSLIGWRFTNPRLQPLSLSMAETAELLAQEYGISRAAQDAYAQSSRQRYQNALEQQIWSEELAIITTKEGYPLTKDEQHRVLSAALLTKMPPIVKGGAYITAGNAARVGDGAAMLLLASERLVRQQQLQPLARISHWASAACHPSRMSYAAVTASKLLLERAQLSSQSLDWVEYSESFALQVLLGIKELNLSPALVNPHGGALSIGNPIAVGAVRTVVSLAKQLQRAPNLYYGLAATSGGLGTGAALLLEQA